MTLYEMLLDLMKDEEKTVQQIRGSMKEVTMVTNGTAVSQFRGQVYQTKNDTYTNSCMCRDSKFYSVFILQNVNLI